MRARQADVQDVHSSSTCESCRARVVQPTTLKVSNTMMFQGASKLYDYAASSANRVVTPGCDCTKCSPFVFKARNNDLCSPATEPPPSPPPSPPASPAAAIKLRPIALVPPLIFAVALAAIVAAYVSSARAGSLAFQGGLVTTPPISLLMFDGPGRLIGQIAFPTVTLTFASVAPTVFRDLRNARRAPKNTPGLAITSAIAFICLGLLGLVPLQRNVPDVMRGAAGLSSDSIVHQSAAAIFFLSSLLHQVLWLKLCYAERESPITGALYHSVSFWFKLGCTLFGVLPLPTAMLVHPASPARELLSLSDADYGGLHQYCLVLCVASFFASYSLELQGVLHPTRVSQARDRRRREYHDLAAHVRVEATAKAPPSGLPPTPRRDKQE